MKTKVALFILFLWVGANQVSAFQSNDREKSDNIEDRRPPIKISKDTKEQAHARANVLLTNVKALQTDQGLRSLKECFEKKDPVAYQELLVAIRNISDALGAEGRMFHESIEIAYSREKYYDFNCQKLVGIISSHSRSKDKIMKQKDSLWELGVKMMAFANEPYCAPFMGIDVTGVFKGFSRDNSNITDYLEKAKKVEESAIKEMEDYFVGQRCQDQLSTLSPTSEQ